MLGPRGPLECQAYLAYLYMVDQDFKVHLVHPVHQDLQGLLHALDQVSVHFYLIYLIDIYSELVIVPLLIATIVLSGL